MLKTVIQQENIHRRVALERASLLIATGSDSEPHAISKPFAHQFDFVAAFSSAAIAPAQNRNGLSVSQVFFRKPQNHGSLPCPAHADIADTHHRAMQPLPAKNAGSIQ